MLVDDLVNRFLSTLPKDDEDREELLSSFQRYLAEQRERLSQKFLAGKSELFMDQELRRCGEKLIDAELDEKKRRLVRDESLEMLRSMSERYFELAKRTLQTGKRRAIDTKAGSMEAVTARVRALEESVRDFNRAEAGELASCIAMDCHFVSVPGSRRVSIRVADYVRALPRDQWEAFRRIHPYLVRTPQEPGAPQLPMDSQPSQLPNPSEDLGELLTEESPTPTPDDLPEPDPIYATDPDTLASIRAWRKSLMRPDIFIIAPMREVGEGDLIAELTQASYEVQGFRDARRRHFVARTYPYTAPETAYARLFDQALDVAEITDGFYGIDNIDLTEWVGKPLGYENTHWQRLVSYIGDHPETDFAFITYTPDVAAAERIAHAITTSCGIALLIVRLDLPSPEAMARTFVMRNEDAFAEHEAYIAERFAGMLEAGWRMSYANVQASVLSAQHELMVQGDARAAIDTVFDRTVELERGMRQVSTALQEGSES